jgi:uncharacterized glyoxalase superfamily protein PhnB
MARLFRVILPVASIEQAAAFYSQVLEQPGARVSPGRHYFDCEGTILACYDPRADGDGQQWTTLPEPIYLAVDDLEGTRKRAAEAGASFFSHAAPDVGRLGDIELRPWGERSFYVRDPFGNPLCFVSRATVFRGEGAAPAIVRAAPYFPVADVAAAGVHYREVLGFVCDYAAGEPPEFAVYRRGAATIMFRRVTDPSRIAPNEGQGGTWDAFFWVDDVERLYQELKGRGAVIVYAPVIQPYGMKEFATRDPSGYVLGFGQEWRHESPV